MKKPISFLLSIVLAAFGAWSLYETRQAYRHHAQDTIAQERVTENATQQLPDANPTLNLSAMSAALSDAIQSPPSAQDQKDSLNASYNDNFQDGLQAYQAKRYSAAALLFQTAYQNEPNPKAQFYLGLNYAPQQQYAAAQAAFAQVLKQPGTPAALSTQARNNLAYIHKEQAKLAAKSHQISISQR